MATLVEEFEILIASKGGAEKLAADIEKEWGRGLYRYPGRHPVPKIPKNAWSASDLDYLQTVLSDAMKKLGRTRHGIGLKIYALSQNPDY